ncbi:MAG: TadE family protein [Planctomycetota bacterium]
MSAPRFRAPKRSRKTRKGIAATEMAIIAPVFLLLFLGVVEMSEAINANDVLSTALREGGRLASMDFAEISMEDNDINGKVEDDIKNFLRASEFPADSVTVNIVHADGQNAGADFDLADPANYLKYCKIEAVVPYSAISQYPVHYLAGQNLTSSFVFRMGKVRLVE